MFEFNLNSKELTVDDLQVGNKAVITGFLDDQLSLLLNELGFFLGETIELSSKAPLGDPLCIKSEESIISIRRVDAKSIVIKKS